MELLTRQQAEHLWFEADPLAQFDDLLEARGLYKDISTEYGLNQSVHHQWRFGDTHKKSGEPDRHDYEIKVVDGFEVVAGPTWHSLYRWIVSQAADFLAFPDCLPYHRQSRPLGGDCDQHRRAKSLAHGRCVVEGANSICGPLWGTYHGCICTHIGRHRAG